MLLLFRVPTTLQVLTPLSQKMALNTDSSPFQSSPLEGKASPRLFWQNRNTENSPYGASSTSPKRRQSIERLQKASRVKNSNILAREQKPENDSGKVTQIERPLSKVQGNAFGGTGISGYRDNKSFAHARSESQSSIPLYSPTKSPPLTRSPPPNGPRPASRDQASPTKSSLATSRFRSSQDQDVDFNSSDSSYEDRELPSGKALHRHPKSVTFDAAPPQINEYEMATPDISSIASSSREGSYDSADEDDDDDDHYFVGAEDHDDSFDATLEDTLKTPVVLPDDWRQDMAPPIDQVFESGLLEGLPIEGLPPFAPGAMLQQDRSDSRNSNGDHRPLPPLPGMNDQRRNSNSSLGLSSTAERMVGSRTLPSPPPASSFTKSDIQNIGNGKMTLEERLRLMMLTDDGKSAAEQQRERRLRRAGTRDRADSSATDADLPHEASVPGEEDDTLADLSALGDYQLPPKISRESIMRRVDGNQALERESDYNFSSPAPSSPERTLPVPAQRTLPAERIIPVERTLPADPDVPIPSTEDSTADESDSNVQLKQEDEDDMSITDYYQHSESEVEDVDDDTREEEDSSDDSASYYSDPDQAPTPQEEKENEMKDDHEKEDEEEVTTPRASSPNQHDSSIDTITEQDLPEITVSPNHNPFTDDLQAFLLPKPSEFETPKVIDIPAPLERPSTPERLTLSKPDYDGSGWGEPDEDEEEEEPKTPDSVIHRPLPEPEEEEARVSPAIPETVATIKSASGSKLKTRPSATPSDIVAMREQRRHVSREVPDIPPVPERHRNRMSRDFDSEQLLSPGSADDEYMQRHPSFKSRSLTLDLDLGLSLDQDFERVIESQKVNFHQSLLSVSNFSSQAVSRQASGAKLSEQPVPGPADTNITPRKQRGYLMRQNTKVVTASDKDTEDIRPPTRSAGNSPVKQVRPQSWTVEPWNGQTRKKSLLKRPIPSGPVPPLPGQESNVAPMCTVTEEDTSTDATAEDSGERGRLFVKVMGVKDLDLPIPKSK